MTDTMVRDEVNDSGEIRHERGQTTQRLKPYTDLPVMRRPTVETRIIDGGCRTIVPEDAPDEFTTAPTEPPKLPPPPPPKVDDRPLSEGEEVIWDYAPVPRTVGRHRRPSRWDWLTVPVSLAVQRLSAAWSEK